MTSTTLPDQGVVFWPVGTGDSVTVVVDDLHVVQVDLRDLGAADEEDAVCTPVIDRLAETLPRDADNDRPYLAVFALTHADADHCCGFADLLESDILIGEIWATPRLWREFAESEHEMCADAKAFQEEAERRVTATLAAVAAGTEPASGDRVRIIGYDVDCENHSYAQLPDEYFTYPGEMIDTLDGDDVSDVFEAFVHAPFKDDCAKERNDTSLSLHLTLRTREGNAEARVLLFGDLAYETIKKIFDYSQPRRPERLDWDVMLAAHHCSKKVMYTTDADGVEHLQQDLLDQFEAHASDTSYVMASSMPFPPSNEPGDNPPHLLARDRYQEVAELDVMCTGEYPTAEQPHPIVFGLQPGEGLVLLPVEDLAEANDAAAASMSTAGRRLLAALGVTAAAVGAGVLAGRERRQNATGLDRGREAVKQARGEDVAPPTPVGFGRP